MSDVKTIEMFATPIWKSELPNFAEHKDKIIAALNEERKKDPQGVRKSNFKGHQTRDTIADIPELNVLFGHVMNVMVPQAIKDCKLAVASGCIKNAWANFNDIEGASNQIHSHDGIFAGVFYVSAPEHCGNLVFLNEGLNSIWKAIQMTDPREQNKYITPYRHIEPKEGDIYIWNSSLLHYVNPNVMPVNRISISFNIDLSSLTMEQIKQLQNR